MTDYFGYDVHFVMNITDIDDKVRVRSGLQSFPTYKSVQIIVRARHNFLVDKFRSETTTISLELITQLREAWRTYIREQVAKGLPDGDKPRQGTEESSWPRLAELFQIKTWKQECLKRNEKFEMHFSNAVSLAYFG